MDYQLDVTAKFTKNEIDVRLVANVDGVMPVVWDSFLEMPPIPRGRGFVAEELSSHIVIDADNSEPLAGDLAEGLGPNETRGTGNDCNRHRILLACLYSGTGIAIRIILHLIGTIGRGL